MSEDLSRTFPGTPRSPDPSVQDLRPLSTVLRAALLALLVAPLAHGQVLPVAVPYAAEFDADVAIRGGQSISVDLAALRAIPFEGEVRVLDFPVAPKATLDLVVERVVPVSTDATTVTVARRGGELSLPRPETHHLVGAIDGVAGSSVFLSTTPAGTFGWIDDGESRWIVSSGDVRSGRAPAVFEMRGAAMGQLAWKPFHCEAVEHGEAQDAEGAEGGVADDALLGTCRSIDLAVDTDEEFLALFDGSVDAAQGYIETIVAAGDAIYRRDTNVRIRLAYSRLWTTADPWTSTSTSAQLTQFRSRWQQTQGSVVRDVATLLSGRGLGGGVAFLDSVCANTAYSVCADLDGFFPTPLLDNVAQNWDVVVFTHELGHNAGSVHTHDRNPPVDGCGLGDCTGASSGTIMSYCHLCSPGMPNIALAFHPLSAGEITSYMSTASCASFVDCTANPACVLAISDPGEHFARAGGLGTVAVTALAANCTWSPVAVPSWITLVDAGPAGGSGSFTYFVAPNTGPARSFTISVGDRPHTVSQDAFVDCDADGVADDAELDADPSLDCDGDGTLNSCEIAAGAEDCDDDGVPDACEVTTSVLSWGAGRPGTAGGANYGQSTPPAGLGRVLATTGGFGHTVAIEATGLVRAWGLDSYGQATVPSTLSQVVDVSSGLYHNAAVSANGRVTCWGRNLEGQCDAPGSLLDAVGVAAGFQHTVALRSNGTLVCWGSNTKGQCDVPAGLGAVADVDAGSLHTLVRLADGTVRAWGDSLQGQTGVPAGLSGAIAVSAGEYHNLVLRNDGGVVAFGYDISGQSQVPADLGPVVAVAAGGLHSLALQADGTIRAWGRNDYGQSTPPAAQGTVSLGTGLYHSVAITSASTMPDCDGDGLSDACAIAAGAPDTDGDGIPDSCDAGEVVGDVNGDGVVNGADLAAILGAWGSADPDADIDGDGVVGGSDLAAVLGAWSTT
jgi:hypothetical protein